MGQRMERRNKLTGSSWKCNRSLGKLQAFLAYTNTHIRHTPIFQILELFRLKYLSKLLPWSSKHFHPNNNNVYSKIVNSIAVRNRCFDFHKFSLTIICNFASVEIVFKTSDIKILRLIYIKSNHRTRVNIKHYGKAIKISSIYIFFWKMSN